MLSLIFPIFLVKLMKQILIYSDSLSWGIIPNTRRRLPFEDRWTGIFERELNKESITVRVIENCLNGRRTVWGDPFKEGRDGSQGLAQVIEMHSPLELVILMLGTNDFQCTHNNNAWLSAQGTVKLINIIRSSPIEPEMPIPEIMIVAPPEIIKPKGYIANKFNGAEGRYCGLNNELKIISKENTTDFFDSNTVITASNIDGLHLDKEQHKTLGQALAKYLELSMEK
jgi:lysophospholipase L1-like esterase